MIFVRLNLDGVSNTNKAPDPDYFVFPASVVERVHRREQMPKFILKDLADYQQYLNNWALITTFLA